MQGTKGYESSYKECFSLNRNGAFKKLQDELRKCKVATAAVQEFGWRRSKVFDSGG